MKIKIISILRNEFNNKYFIEVIWKYKKRQQVNYIISDENFTEEYILNYLKKIQNNLNLKNECKYCHQQEIHKLSCPTLKIQINL